MPPHYIIHINILFYNARACVFVVHVGVKFHFPQLHVQCLRTRIIAYNSLVFFFPAVCQSISFCAYLVHTFQVGEWMYR